MMNALLMVALVTSGGGHRGGKGCSTYAGCSGCSYACSCSYSCSSYGGCSVSYRCSSGCSYRSGCSCFSSCSCSGCSCSYSYGCSYGCSGCSSCSWGCSGCTIVCSSCTVTYGGMRPVGVSAYPATVGYQVAAPRQVRIAGPNEPFAGPTLTPVSASMGAARPVVVYYNN